jgi:hypothetical protein
VQREEKEKATGLLGEGRESKRATADKTKERGMGCALLSFYENLKVLMKT